jgi:UDP-glucose 4-epimerase
MNQSEIDWKKLEGQKIVVTGCAGFIGSHLTELLLSHDVKVIGVDNYYNGLEQNIIPFLKNPNFTFYCGDVRDQSFLIEICKEVYAIFHEAAFISVPQSILMAGFCNDVNVTGTVNILNAARLNDVERVVFASSAAVYGDDPELPKHEKMFLTPISPYGVSKLAGESYLMAYYKAYGLKTTALRYFNVYGPRQRKGVYSGVMSIFIENILRNGIAPTIFGDGSQTRDFVYVKDIVKANVLSATHPNAPGNIFNVATGQTIDMTTLTKLILKYTGREDLPIHYGPVRAGDIVHSSADASKIRTLIGFHPDYDIDKGLSEYISHLKTIFK